jgi:peptidoglycan/LPS O-acetylase OafA/YrhL
MNPMPERAISPSRVGGTQIHSLTAVRGLAAWWVVLFHFDAYLRPYLPVWIFDFVSRGYLAVDLFFCLSGFVIFFNYGGLNFASVREIRTFYLKRFAKIYPLHLFTICLYVSLLGVLLLTHRSIPEDRFSGESLLQNLLLVQDWNFASDLTWNVPSWSISAEFAAYLLFPALVVLVRLVAGRLAASLVAITLLLGLLNFFYVSKGFQIGAAIPVLGVVRCAVQFGIGMILAQLYLMRSFANRLARPFLFALAVLFFLLGLWKLESVMIPLAWAALVFAVALGDLKSGFLNWSWLIFVGEISYSTYMIHYFVRDIFKMALVKGGEVTPLQDVLLAFLVILAVSVPLYLLIERPAQKYLTARVRLKEIGPKPTGQAA